MKIHIQVKLRSKTSKLEKLEDLLWSSNHFRAYIRSAPTEGKANQELIDLISDYFHIRKDQARIVLWQTSTQKVVEIVS